MSKHDQIRQWQIAYCKAAAEYLDTIGRGQIVKSEHAKRRMAKAERMLKQARRNACPGYPYQTRDRRVTLDR